MTIEDDIIAQLENLEEEEAENLSAYMEEHPEEFASLWASIPHIRAERWRNAQQARARAKQNKRYYDRKKAQQQLDALMLGLDLTLSDKRIRRIKVYSIRIANKIQVKG